MSLRFMETTGTGLRSWPNTAAAPLRAAGSLSLSLLTWEMDTWQPGSSHHHTEGTASLREKHLTKTGAREPPPGITVAFASLPEQECGSFPLGTVSLPSPGLEAGRT